MKRMILASVLLLAFGVAAHAQDPAVRLVFEDGLVTLTADNALISDVLAEWERVGGTTIRGLDHLPAERVSITLRRVHERSALDAVLGAAGYVSTLRSDLPAGMSWLKAIIVAPRSSPTSPAVERQIDMSIPESRYAFPGSDEDEAEYVRAVLASAPPPATRPAQVLPMPEIRFNYPTPPLEPEVEAEAESKPRIKPKKPAGR